MEHKCFHVEPSTQALEDAIAREYLSSFQCVIHLEQLPQLEGIVVSVAHFAGYTLSHVFQHVTQALAVHD